MNITHPLIEQALDPRNAPKDAGDSKGADPENHEALMHRIGHLSKFIEIQVTPLGIVITGTVPTYRAKQLAQELLMNHSLMGVYRNMLEVPDQLPEPTH